MLLYKFKGGGDALYALDIAIHERLYCARYSELNDPFEGQFQAKKLKRGGFLGGMTLNSADINGASGPSFLYYDSLDGLEGNTRVCSLTSAYDDVRMWALYGDSSRGVAFEFEVPDDHPDLHRVHYQRTLPHASLGLLNTTNTVDVLTCKTIHWEYEQEWRFITDESSPYVLLPGALRRVLIGHRAPMAVQEALLKVAPEQTTVHRVTLNPEGINLEIEPPLCRPGPRSVLSEARAD